MAPNKAPPQRATGQPAPAASPPAPAQTMALPELQGRPRFRKQLVVALPPPHKRYLAYCAAGLVLFVAGCFGLAWMRDSAGWHNEAQARRRGALLAQAAALHGQIDAFGQQAQRLEEKARILTEYAVDLRYSGNGDDGSAQLQQADRVLVDRDRLRNEIDKLNQRLVGLRRELAALNAP